jgi:hypothetical protein
MNGDEENEEDEWDECCVCHRHWTGLASSGELASFFRCSECGGECCEGCWNEDIEMCDDCKKKKETEEEEE